MVACRVQMCSRLATHRLELSVFSRGSSRTPAVLVFPKPLCPVHAREMPSSILEEAWEAMVDHCRLMNLGSPDPATFVTATAWGVPKPRLSSSAAKNPARIQHVRSDSKSIRKFHGGRGLVR